MAVNIGDACMTVRLATQNYDADVTNRIEAVVVVLTLRPGWSWGNLNTRTWSTPYQNLKLTPTLIGSMPSAH